MERTLFIKEEYVMKRIHDQPTIKVCMHGSAILKTKIKRFCTRSLGQWDD